MADEKTRAVFFDRDGTIMEDCVYCSDPKNVKIFPGVPEALRRLIARLESAPADTVAVAGAVFLYELLRQARSH